MLWLACLPLTLNDGNVNMIQLKSVLSEVCILYWPITTILLKRWSNAKEEGNSVCKPSCQNFFFMLPFPYWNAIFLWSRVQIECMFPSNVICFNFNFFCFCPCRLCRTWTNSWNYHRFKKSWWSLRNRLG